MYVQLLERFNTFGHRTHAFMPALTHNFATSDALQIQMRMRARTPASTDAHVDADADADADTNTRDLTEHTITNTGKFYTDTNALSASINCRDTSLKHRELRLQVLG